VHGETTSGYAIYGHVATGGSGLAAQFDGDVVVNGHFTVNPISNKSVAVTFPDGSLHRMYCMESPENWFEDFGGGSLTAGRATIALDPDFAYTIQTDGYRVFLTAEGPSNGLYVSSKSATGFVVQEQGNGTSNVAFSYRVVGRRKEGTHARLERINLPPPPQVPEVPSLPPNRPAGETRRAPDAPPPPPPVQTPPRNPRR
jgi:hypothetical protein